MSFKIFIPTIHRTLRAEDIVNSLNWSLISEKLNYPSDEIENTCKVRIVEKNGRRFAFVIWDKFPENETATRFKTKIESGSQIKLVYNDPYFLMCCKMNERETKPKQDKPFLEMD